MATKDFPQEEKVMEAVQVVSQALVQNSVKNQVVDDGSRERERE